MIGLNKCTGSCNVLSQKICVPKETKDINVKAFNMITNTNEAKAMIGRISCDCKCKFNSTTCNSNQEWNYKTCQCKYKNHDKHEKDYSWNPSTCICENGGIIYWEYWNSLPKICTPIGKLLSTITDHVNYIICTKIDSQ